MIEIVRSPAKVSWHMLLNGIFISAYPTKKLAERDKSVYERKYGLGAA